MQEEHDRLQKLAQNLRRPAQFHMEGNEITIEFENFHDCSVFQRDAWPNTEYTHTVFFKDPEFIPIWLAEVDPVMSAARASTYRLVVETGSVRFRTEDSDTYRLFVDFENQGMFDGPDGGKASWGVHCE